MKKTFQITLEGKKELQKEVEDLKSQRGEIAEKIANARDFGDLSENAEYDAARDEQGRVESRIAEIEEILLNASIIEGGDSGVVGLGSEVELKTDKKTVVYTLVGPVEANPIEGKISNESPIGIALLGKKLGDQVTVKTPKGELVYEISSIK